MNILNKLSSLEYLISSSNQPQQLPYETPEEYWLLKTINESFGNCLKGVRVYRVDSIYPNRKITSETIVQIRGTSIH